MTGTAPPATAMRRRCRREDYRLVGILHGCPLRHVVHQEQVAGLTGSQPQPDYRQGDLPQLAHMEMVGLEHQNLCLVLAAFGLIIPMIIRTIRRDPSRPAWTDDAPNVSRVDPTGADQSDADHPPTDLAVGGFESLAARHILAGQSVCLCNPRSY
jgi:hypothetical protein